MMNIFESLNLYANSFKYYYGSDRNSTFVRGILKQNYRFPKMLSEQDLLKIDKKASILSYSAVLGAIVLFLIYFYAVFFKNYDLISQQQPIVFSLMITVPVMVAILIPYLIANSCFNSFLKRFGAFSRVKEPFRVPQNATSKTIPGYERIQRRVFKEALLGFIGVLIFLAIVLFVDYSPEIAVALIKSGNYKAALNVSDIAAKIVPVSPGNYGVRGAAKFYMKDYKGAVDDYKLANKLSDLNAYDADLYVAKSKILNKQQMLAEFDKAIKTEKIKAKKYSIVYLKANYLYSIKAYSEALANYNILTNAFNNDEDLLFPQEDMYFRRAMTFKHLGRVKEANIDMKAANTMCPDCNYQKLGEKYLEFVPSLDY